MAGKFYLIGLIAGSVLIGIGAVSLFGFSETEFGFIRGMMVVITGIIVLALGIRFKSLRL